jgi:hypothetical protein
MLIEVPPTSNGAAQIEKTIASAASLLTRFGRIGAYFTQNELSEELRGVIYEILTSEKSADLRTNRLSAKIPQVISSIRWQIRDWRIIVPFENLVLPRGKQFHVGEVAFFTFGQGHSQKMLRQIKTSLLGNPHYANKPNMIEKIVNDRKKTDIATLLGKCCATTVVFGRSDDAYEDGVFKIEESVAAIKLFRYQNDDFYGRHFGIIGTIIPRTHRTMLLHPEPTGYVGMQSEIVGAFFEYEIDGQRSQYMRAAGLLRISKILAKKTRTEVEQRIISAMLWFAKATDVILVNERKMSPLLDSNKTKTRKVQAAMMAPYDRLLKLMISLESLLVLDQREPITSTISDRIAQLLGGKYDKRKKVASFVKKMYGKRSEVVHHGGKDIADSDLLNLLLLVQAVIMKMIKKSNVLNSDNSLRDWFDRQRLGCA